MEWVAKMVRHWVIGWDARMAKGMVWVMILETMSLEYNDINIVLL